MALTWRERAWEELSRRSFDLLVIGGGIIGAGVAHEAARAGLAVALVDRADFGSQTTSASSKLIHGGLRYLRLGDVRLVREAHRERRALMRVVAPHLVRPLSFLLPLYRDGPYRALTVRAGLSVYSGLAGERLARAVNPEAARGRVPPLRLDGLRSCAVYADAVTHDGRLCLANVRAAADAGATVANYADVVALRTSRGRVAGAEVRDALGDETAVVRARTVVNATGPWVDHVRRLEDANAPRSSRLSKGVHVLLPLEATWSAALTVPHDAVRVSFAVPWEGLLLLGTTETPFDENPDALRVTEEDVQAVLAEAAVALDGALLRADAVRATFAGLRVLPNVRGEPATARRETILVRGRGGMLSIAGGKLTTYRRIALNVLTALRAELGLHRVETRPVALPGAGDPDSVAALLARRHPELEPRAREHLAHLYGGLADDVVAAAGGDPARLAPLAPGAPDLTAQAVYAREHEWACTAADVLVRRTTVAYRGEATREVAERVEKLLGSPRVQGRDAPARR
ncbi:MAG TPA: glycerol-3-phosphate dehydrogenase/oxidase [Gaiellaceae bacterium]|nr:glycerol-3-phosphate dehydrogenase/oxidase [Gaiellaceae bacterium]